MKLLPDKPYQKSDNKALDFAYEEFAASLVTIIKSCPTPFTIGMFGAWGSGKSTIIRNLKEQLDTSKYLYLTFDVWKYEKDSLRRSFLLDVGDQINKDPLKRKDIDLKKIEKKLYKSTSHPQTEFNPDYRLILITAVLGILAGLISWLLLDEAISPVSSGFAVSIGAMLLYQISRLKPEMFYKKVNVSTNPIASPEEFEKIFKEEFIKPTKRTVVIVIDNLDRTQKEKTVELLSTIKTFLNTDSSDEDVIFIIACDDKAIKEHIASQYGFEKQQEQAPDEDYRYKSNFNVNEFLRKFFNVVVELPQLIEVDVSKFTKKMLADTEVSALMTTEVQLIINHAYERNPREIKQFINTFAAYHSLLTEDESKNGLSGEFVEENLNFVCKMIVIRDCFEYVFSDIKSWSTAATTWPEIEAILTKKEYGKSFDDFHQKTLWARPTQNYITWFFRLRRSEQDKALDGWDEFLIFASQQNFEESIKVFNDFENFTELDDQLIYYLSRIRTDEAKITNFFPVLLNAVTNANEQKRLSLKKSVDVLLDSTPKGRNLVKIIGTLDLQQATTVIQKAKKSSRNTFRTNFNSMLRLVNTGEYSFTEENILDLTKAYTLHPDFYKESLSKFVSIIERTHPTYELLAYLSDKEAKHDLISRAAISNYVGKLNVDASVDLDRWRVLEQYSLVGCFDSYLNLSVSLLNNVVAQGDAVSIERSIDVVCGTWLVQGSDVQDIQREYIPTVDNLMTILRSQFGNFQPELQMKIIETMWLLRTIPGNEANEIAVRTLRKYIERENVSSIKTLLGKLDDTKNAEIQTSLRDRLANNNSFIYELLTYIDESHYEYVAANVIQNATVAGDANTYVEQMNIANYMYKAANEESTRHTLSQNVMNALRAQEGRFPTETKTLVNRVKYPFTSADQAKEIRELLKSRE